MLSCWNLTHNSSGTGVRYKNLQSGAEMDCGVATLKPDDLLIWMLNQQDCNSVIFYDGEYMGMILPSRTDAPPEPFFYEDIGEA